MDFVQNFPAISILICLFAGIISSGLKGRTARYINTALILIVIFLSFCTLGYVLGTGEAYVLMQDNIQLSLTYSSVKAYWLNRLPPTKTAVYSSRNRVQIQKEYGHDLFH